MSSKNREGMKIQQKIAHLQDNHLSEWLRVRRETENEISDKHLLFCVCGRLATGLHENCCKKFQDKITSETLKKLKHLMIT